MHEKENKRRQYTITRQQMTAKPIGRLLFSTHTPPHTRQNVRIIIRLYFYINTTKGKQVQR